jgi:hypothetical protein
MKTKAFLLGLVLASPLALFAASNDAMLLMGKNVKSEGMTTVVTGEATAIIGDMRVSADTISYTFEQSKPLLKCTGNVTVCSAGRIANSQDTTIELDSRATIYILNKNGIMVGANGTGFDLVSPSNDPKEQFSRRLPKLELKLSPERL